MIPLNSEQFKLLAEGWGDLIFIIVFVIVSAISAIAKSKESRSGDSENANAKTQRLIELAKRRKAMQESGRDVSVPKEATPYARTVRTEEHKPGTLSEWDRRLQEKKRQTEQRRNRPQQPRYVNAERNKPETIRPPEEIPVAQAVHQPEPSGPVFKPPKITQKPRPKRASQRIPKPTIRRAVSIPTAKAAAEPKRRKPAIQKESRKPTDGRKTLTSLLKQKNSLRSAIVLKEILDKPIGLREGW